MASVAAVQGWAGSILYRLDFPDLEPPTRRGAWPLVATHPLAALMLRGSGVTPPRLATGDLVYRRVRRDITAPKPPPSGRGAIAVDNPVEQALLISDDSADPPGALALVGRCVNSTNPRAEPVRWPAPTGNVIASTGGETRWVRDAPRFEWHAHALPGFVGAAGEAELTFPDFRVSLPTPYSLFAVASVDGLGMSESRRLFVTLVNDFRGHNRSAWAETDRVDKHEIGRASCRERV